MDEKYKYNVAIPDGEWGGKSFLGYDDLDDAIVQADRFGGTVDDGIWFIYASPQRWHRTQYESYCVANDLRISTEDYARWGEEHPELPRRVPPIVPRPR